MADPGRRVALLCAQVPAEVVVACGLEPWPITGREEARPDPALPQNLCALVRRAATVLRSRSAPPAAIVLADSCYPLLRLHDHLQADRAPARVLLLRVPRKRDPEAVGFFRAELERLARALETVGGRFPDVATLSAANAGGARERRAQASCLAALLDGSIPALTSDLLRALETGGALPDPAAASASGPNVPTRPRLLLAGSCFVCGGLLRLLEELGAVVAGVDACGYTRLQEAEPDPVPGADPWTELAHSWLARPPCPRAADAESRAAAAAALAARGAIEAVLYLRTACCTPQAYDLARWRHRLRAAGVPFCAVEADGPDWDQPRLVTRVEAFVESLARKDRAGAAR